MYTAKAIDMVEEALKIYRELGDKIMEGNSMITRGIACGSKDAETVKYYDKALEILIQNGGNISLQMQRLYINYGIYYEEIKNYDKAYQMFKNFYEVGVELYGENHPKSLKGAETLNEPLYKRIAQNRGDKLPNRNARPDLLFDT